MSEAFVTVHDFRRKLEQYLIHADRPLVISHRGMPMGYFIPARVWHERGKVETFRRTLSAILEMSGYEERDLRRSIEDFAGANAGAIRERLLAGR